MFIMEGCRDPWIDSNTEWICLDTEPYEKWANLEEFHKEISRYEFIRFREVKPDA